MPRVSSLTDFNRNQSAVIAELEKTGEPLYLTRNGKGSVVVMDAAAFDDAMAFRDEVRQREMEVYSDLLQGYEDVRCGRVSPASEAFARIRQAKGWA